MNIGYEINRIANNSAISAVVEFIVNAKRIPNKKKNSGYESKHLKVLASIFPLLKRDELEMLAKLNSKDDIKKMAKEHGWDDKRIKSEL
jgi:hypothetical protein